MFRGFLYFVALVSWLGRYFSLLQWRSDTNMDVSVVRSGVFYILAQEKDVRS